ncbi:MAG: hypothetical protein LBJ14_08440, partial [Desulfarculales bacterium]|jgi:hypothetical protein|nr:hypothetical protein [Desulfarculales bacterium]
MSLIINWQQGEANHALFAYGLGSADQAGKLHIASSPSLQRGKEIDSAAASANIGLPDEVTVSAGITMDGFLSTLRDNLTNLDMKDGNLKSKDIEPLLRAFAATVNQLDEAF